MPSILLMVSGVVGYLVLAAIIQGLRCLASLPARFFHAALRATTERLERLSRNWRK